MEYSEIRYKEEKCKVYSQALTTLTLEKVNNISVIGWKSRCNLVKKKNLRWIHGCQKATEHHLDDGGSDSDCESDNTVDSDIGSATSEEES